MSISLFRSISGQYNDLLGVNSVSMMNTISHQIEDQVIGHGMPVDFYAGFQRFSYCPTQMRRYGRLGATCRRVYVFGIADIKPPSIPGIEFVEISPNSPLAHEWFLLIDTPTFWTTLMTQEVEGRDEITGGRRFEGLWSYDEQVVDRASLLMSQIMGSVYQPVRQRDHAQQSRHIAEINARMIGMMEHSRISSNRRWTHLCTMQKIAELLATPQRASSLYPNVVGIMQMIFKAPSVAIALSEGNGVFSTVASEGESSAGVLRIGDGPSGRTAESGAAIRITDMRKSRERDPLLPSAQSIITAPLVDRNGVQGVIALGSGEPNAWADDDSSTLNAIGMMLGGAVSQRDNSDVSGQLEHARRLEQAVLKLRGPFTRLQDLQGELRGNGFYTTEQLAILTQMETLTGALGQILGVQKSKQIADYRLPFAQHLDLLI